MHGFNFEYIMCGNAIGMQALALCSRTDFFSFYLHRVKNQFEPSAWRLNLFSNNVNCSSKSVFPLNVPV